MPGGKRKVASKPFAPNSEKVLEAFQPLASQTKKFYGPLNGFGMFEGFEDMDAHEYFMLRYNYYSTHPQAQTMSFEEHLESLDRLMNDHASRMSIAESKETTGRVVPETPFPPRASTLDARTSIEDSPSTLRASASNNDAMDEGDFDYDAHLEDHPIKSNQLTKKRKLDPFDKDDYEEYKKTYEEVHEIEKQVDDLLQRHKELDSRLHKPQGLMTVSKTPRKPWTVDEMLEDGSLFGTNR